MAIVVLLFDQVDGDVGLRADDGPHLARLGITDLTLLRDGSALAAVLEGWAFDPTDADAAAAILAGHRSVRTLREILRVAIGDTGSRPAPPIAQNV